MPDPPRQAAALALLDGEPAGPLIVRWSLHGGFKYEQAKAKYEPFNQLVDQDPATRASLAELAARYALAGQPVVIAINNKAEGSAPLSCVELARAIIDAYARLLMSMSTRVSSNRPLRSLANRRQPGEAERHALKRVLCDERECTRQTVAPLSSGDSSLCARTAQRIAQSAVIRAQQLCKSSSITPVRISATAPSSP